MLDRMTALTLAATAIVIMSVYAAVDARLTLRRERRTAAAVGDEPPLPIERAGWFYDDGSDGDPTWYMRALAYGHDPDLSGDDRAALAPLFHRFDRVMTDAFARLDRVGVTA